MFKTIAHQTLENRNNNEDVEANGPFSVEDPTKSFLGEGYYFWDNHIELAKWWGKFHCRDKYIICESEFEIEKTDFLDLVGSREDQIHFSNLMKQLNMEGQALGKIIGALKDLEKEDKGIFSYKAIRAVDNKAKKSFEQIQYKFSEEKNKPSYSVFNPMYMICLLEKNDVILQSYKVVFSV